MQLKAENKQERPLPLRPEIVDKYINGTLNSQGGQTGLAASIISEVYKLNVDNRILNNLKQQLNELIDDERSLISVSEFKPIFFTYFKDGQKSAGIYEKLL
jgi:Ca2+-binding EF-hand superfamily protein